MKRQNSGAMEIRDSCRTEAITAEKDGIAAVAAEPVSVGSEAAGVVPEPVEGQIIIA